MSTFLLIPGLVIVYQEHEFELVTVINQQLEFEEIYSRDKLNLTESDFYIEIRSKNIRITDSKSSPKQLLTNVVDELQEPFINLNDISEKNQSIVHRKIKYISECIKVGISRGQRKYIDHERHRIAKLINDPLGAPGASTIQGWWIAWEESHKDSSRLVSGHALKRRHTFIDLESENFIQDQINTKYAVLTRPKVGTAYKAYRTSLAIENISREKLGKPSLRQIAYRTFYNRIKALPQDELAIARKGKQAARIEMRMIKGHLPAEYPLDSVEIDHSPMNLYVIDDKVFLPLGRPWLTAIKDRYSGVLLGFSISFQPTGLDSILSCIQHSLEPHTKAYELWPDIVNPWPCYGLGNYYVSDRGRDFLSPKYLNAITSLGANYEHCEKRTPWLKGSVERFFGTLESTFFDALPGKTFPHLSKRGDYNPKKHAVIRFSNLIYLIYKWAADYHNVTENSRKRARPIDLWNEGIAIVPPPMIRSLDKLDIILGDENMGSLSHEGIRFKRLNYADEQLHHLLKEIGTGSKVKFYVSRRDLRSIYVLHPNSKEYLEVPCTRQDYANGLTLFQHSYIQKEAGKISSQNEAVDTYLVAQERIINETRESLEINKSTNYSKAAQLSDVNSTAVINGNPNSITNTFKNRVAIVKNNSSSAQIIQIPTYQRKKLKWG